MGFRLPRFGGRLWGLAHDAPFPMASFGPRPPLRSGIEDRAIGASLRGVAVSGTLISMGWRLDVDQRDKRPPIGSEEEPRLVNVE